MRRHGPAVALVIALALAACRTSGDDALAKLDGHVLTLHDFEDRLAMLPPELRARYASTEARQKLLDDMIRLEVLTGEARRRGVDRSPRMQVRISELLAEEMMNGLFASEGAEAAKVTDDEIRRYYDAHSAEFSSPEERRASDVVVGETEGRDLGFFSATSANRPPEPIREAVFRLVRVGEATEPIPSDGKFHVLTLTGLRPAIVRSLPEAQVLIRGRIAETRRREAMSRFTDDLVKSAHVEVHRELLPRGASSAASPENGEAP